MVLGLIFAVVLAKGSVLKALTMILCGLLLSMIGSDLETGAERMTWGIPELSDGIGFVVVGMGMFGFGEILRNLEQPGSREIIQSKVTGLMPTLPDLKASAGAIGRGTVIGSLRTRRPDASMRWYVRYGSAHQYAKPCNSPVTGSILGCAVKPVGSGPPKSKRCRVSRSFESS